MTSLLRRCTIALSLSALTSCTSILGIEELHEGDAAPKHSDATDANSKEDAPGDGAGGGPGSALDADGAAGSAGHDSATESPVDGGDASSDSDRRDGASTDAIVADGSPRDAVAVDADASDASLDGAKTDASDASVDGGIKTDASDASLDTGVVDTGVVDTGAIDTGVVDTGAIETSVPVEAAVEAGPALITLQGHLIDAWRHDVPGAQITVGATSVNTDATGHFVIPDVMPPYDISALVFGSSASNVGTQGWLYRGLRRPDPTLQVYVALPQRSNSVLAQFSNVTFPLADNATVLVAFGSADGSGGTETTSSSINFSSILWRGPALTNGTLHGLRMQRASSDFNAPPTMYQGYDGQPYTLDDSSPSTQVALNLATTAISTGNVSGVVASAATGEAENDAWLVFSSGGVMQLLADAKGNGAFSYLVPTLPASSIVFSAQRGSHYRPPYAVAHVDGLAPGAAVGTVTVPAVATPTLPVTGATGVNNATSFMWNGQGSDTISIMGIAFQNVDVNFFVVTSGANAVIPTIPGLAAPKNALALWSVETHGPYATVDDAAGPTGMLDAFRQTGEYLRPPTPSRRFTKSEERSFTSAP